MILRFLCLFLALSVSSCTGEEKPVTPPADTQVTPPQPAPLVEKKAIADWCPEHAVPESICTRCNDSLIAGFKEKGDWCAKHELPDSQCLECHPEHKAKFEAMAPKK